MFIKLINKYNIKIPDKAIIVSNHPSIFDGIILNLVLKSGVIFIADAKARIRYKWLFKLFNIKTIPNDSACIKTAVDVINKGGRICICPEGMLSKYAMGNYFRGFIKIAELTKINIYPLKITYNLFNVNIEYKPILFYFFPKNSYRLFKEYCLN